MNEISRCCRVLGVTHGISAEDLKKTYRDLVQVWHPDRFAGNERLQSKAQEQLKEINLAYDYLIAHAFVDGVLIEPGDELAAEPSPLPPETESAPESPEPSTNPSSPKFKRWALIASVAFMLAVIFLLVQAIWHPLGGGKSAFGGGDGYAYSKELLPEMSATNNGGALQSPQLLTPPFNLKIKLKLTNDTELRLLYEFGHFTFNAKNNPATLFVRAPRSFAFEQLTGQGALTINEPHEINWEVTASNETLSVDGQVRFRDAGYFSGIKGFPAINPFQDAVQLASFVVETPLPLAVAPKIEPSAPVPDDLLPIMIPDHNLRVGRSPEGIILSVHGYKENGFMTPQHFHPPFTIKTRAKTDAYNIRLFCGPGQLTFNWDGDPYKIRMDDFPNTRNLTVPGKGMVTPNEWHVFRWEIEKTGFKLYIDDELRWQKKMDFSTFNNSVGIGASVSRVTVDYFLVEEK